LSSSPWSAAVRQTRGAIFVAVDDGYRYLDGIAEIRLTHFESELAFLAGTDVGVDPKRSRLVVGYGGRVAGETR